MARIPFADAGAPELKRLAERIVAERGELLDLYRVLLHSPPIADGWRALMTAVRQQTSLPARLRELVIIRIAHLNGASYEAEQHIPLAERAGASRQQIDALRDSNTWPVQLFDERERAALALTDEMTRRITVRNRAWAPVRELFSDTEIVELVATIASYNMVSRFLEALEIHAGAKLRV
jgi:AhpD family alkylhydroperoxidase